MRRFFAASIAARPGAAGFRARYFAACFSIGFCPTSYERIVSIDSDMLIRRAGLGRLAEIDLGGAPIAAAYDMIFLMDFNGGALARQLPAPSPFAWPQPRRRPISTPASWRSTARGGARLELGERAMAALRATPDRYPFLEQSALNELIAGGFAPLSPRYNFMGDFFLLDLEKFDRSDRPAFRQ